MFFYFITQFVVVGFLKRKSIFNVFIFKLLSNLIQGETVPLKNILINLRLLLIIVQNNEEVNKQPPI